MKQREEGALFHYRMAFAARRRNFSILYQRNGLERAGRSRFTDEREYPEVFAIPYANKFSPAQKKPRTVGSNSFDQDNLSERHNPDFNIDRRLPSLKEVAV